MQASQIKALTESNDKLLETIEELKEVIEKLTDQMDGKNGSGKKDSHNSSKPPSSDRYAN